MIALKFVKKGIYSVEGPPSIIMSHLTGIVKSLVITNASPTLQIIFVMMPNWTPDSPGTALVNPHCAGNRCDLLK